MKGRLAIRVLIILNVLFWIVALSFPFARFYSASQVRTLSGFIADACLLFPVVLFVMAVVIDWRNRHSLSSRKYDLIFALCVVVADAFLMSRV
jgi:hypothetical protein